MRYLKKYKGLNESNLLDINFDIFKEIMYEITDDYQHTFNDYSDTDYSDTDAGFYDCQIKLYSDTENLCIEAHGLLFLEDVIDHLESPDNIDMIYVDGRIYNEIENSIDNLSKYKEEIDRLIELNEKLKILFKDIEEYIIPRFKQFSNFLQSGVGINYVTGELRITFEIK